MKTPILFALLLTLAACSDKSSPGTQGAPSEQRLTTTGATQSPRRYLALKHQLSLQVPAATLSQHFNAIQAECLKANCEILSAGQQAESSRQSATARLSARVPPATFNGFFSGVQTHGKLLSHLSQSEDKTAAMIDVEARIKNLEALQTRILELLAQKTGSLKDVLEAEKELSETQIALDNIRGQRAALASQTEMIRIDIDLQAESLRNGGSWTAPVVIAADNAGEVLMSSVAFLLTTIVALLPWGLALALVLIPLRRVWRKWRAARLAKKQAGM